MMHFKLIVVIQLLQEIKIDPQKEQKHVFYYSRPQKSEFKKELEILKEKAGIHEHIIINCLKINSSWVCAIMVS